MHGSLKVFRNNITYDFFYCNLYDVRRKLDVATLGVTAFNVTEYYLAVLTCKL